MRNNFYKTMEKFKCYFRKYLKQIIAVIFCFAIFIIILIPKPNKREDNVISYEMESKIKDEKKEEHVIETIKIDIKGAVINPGVYELEIGSRVKDAINSAGGLSENANVEYINLSKQLKDEMVIIIYTNEYIEKYKNNEVETIYIKYECDCPDQINDACITENNVMNENKNNKEVKKDNTNNNEISNDKISINTGTIDELMTLSGIGESKAKAIIEYRETNGEFKTLEDIMNVSGIGEAAYSKIKDNIKL